MTVDTSKALSELRRGLAFAQESAKLEFSIQLHDLMDRCSINQRILAQRTGKTEAYISKALRGDANLTIDTIVQLVCSSEGRFEFRLCQATSTSRWVEIIDCGKRPSWDAPGWKVDDQEDLGRYDIHEKAQEGSQHDIAA